MEQMFGVTKCSTLDGCMLGSLQAVNSSFTKKP